MSAATTPWTRSSAAMLLARRAAARRSRAVRQRPHVVRDRPEGAVRRHSDRRVGVGAVEPGHRPGARSGHHAGRLRARRRFNIYAHAERIALVSGYRGIVSASDEQKPHHYREMARIAWENRDQLPFAWRILSDGVCDGCALGTSGLSDWTMPGHAPLHGAARADAAEHGARARSVACSRDVASLAGAHVRRSCARSAGCRSRCCAGAASAASASSRGTRRSIASRPELRAVDPARAAFYLTSRGITNEVYYAAQKAARFLGTQPRRQLRAAVPRGVDRRDEGDARLRRVDLQLRRLARTPTSSCSSARTSRTTSRSRRSTCTTPSRTARRSPSSTRTASRASTRYWIPSIPKSALFGTALADHWFDVHTGGDLAFLVGVLRALVEIGGVDEAFVRERTVGFDEARDACARPPTGTTLERESGATRERHARRSRGCSSSGRTPSSSGRWGSRSTRTASTRSRRSSTSGSRAGCPAGRIAASCRFAATPACRAAPKSAACPASTPRPPRAGADVWGFPVADRRGLDRAEMVDHAAAGDVDVFWIVGGNFLETLPDADAIAARALAAAAAPHPSGHRAVVVDARRRRRRRAAPAGDDALRVARRRHRDVDRAAHHLLAGDSRAAGSARRGRSGGCSAR